MSFTETRVMTMNDPRSMTSQCRVAIVDSKPVYHGRIAELLHDSENVRGFITLSSLAQRDEHSPMVVIVGPSLIAPDELAQFGRMLRQRPMTALVLAALDPTPELMRWADRIGVSDIIDLRNESHQLADAVDATIRSLEAPFSGEMAIEVDSSHHDQYVPEVEEVQYSDAQPPLAGEVITVFSTKGGVGKSTVASNLAATFAQTSDRPVVLVDADFQFGDLAVMLKLQPTLSLADITESMDRLDRSMLESVLVRHEKSGVYLLPSAPTPIVGDFMSAEDMYRLLDVLSEFAGHIIVDTQTHIDEATLAILRRSNQLILVGGTDIPTLKDMKTAMQLLRKSGVSTEHAHLIINRAAANSRVDLGQIERTLHLHIDATVDDDQSVPRSIGKRCPVVVQQPNAGFSHAMKRLAGILEESR